MNSLVIVIYDAFVVGKFLCQHIQDVSRQLEQIGGDGVATQPFEIAKGVLCKQRGVGSDGGVATGWVATGG